MDEWEVAEVQDAGDPRCPRNRAFKFPSERFQLDRQKKLKSYNKLKN